MRDPNPGFKSDSGIFNGYKLWVQGTGFRVVQGMQAPCIRHPVP